MIAVSRLRELDAVQFVFLGLTLVLAVIHLSLALLDPVYLGSRSEQFLIIGLAFLAGFAVQLTPYWRPVLYLLGAAFALFLGMVWLLGPSEQFAVSVITAVAVVTFIVFALYLFVREEFRAVN